MAISTLCYYVCYSFALFFPTISILKPFLVFSVNENRVEKTHTGTSSHTSQWLSEAVLKIHFNFQWQYYFKNHFHKSCYGQSLYNGKLIGYCLLKFHFPLNTFL